MWSAPVRFDPVHAYLQYLWHYLQWVPRLLDGVHTTRFEGVSDPRLLHRPFSCGAAFQERVWILHMLVRCTY
jgi:hypothetical protein